MLHYINDSQHWETLNIPAPDETESDPLIVTRLTIPPTRLGLVSRPRLLARLDIGTERKLTLISGLAGSGKTTLLSEWAQRCSCPVAWVSLEANNNDLIRFWRCIVAALERVQADFHRFLSNWLQSLQTTFTRSVFIVLINTITALPQDFVLVLDNYDVICNQAIHQSLIFLLEHLPPNMHIFVASCKNLPLPLSRLRAHGDLNEVFDTDLSFTYEEAKVFLTRVLTFPLTEHMLAKLISHTEGWITGLHLAALSLQTCGDMPDATDIFMPIDNYICDYVANEVLQWLPEAIQTFLLETSILDCFCASLCNLLTDRTDSQQILEQLESNHVFIVSLDKQKRWFRYRHVFRDALYRKMIDTKSGTIPALHRKAYKWYEAELAHQTLNSLPKDDLVLQALGLLRAGFTSWFEGNSIAAMRTLVRAKKAGQAVNNTSITLIALTNLAHVEMLQDQLHQAFKTYQQALQLITEQKGYALWIAPYVYICAGCLFYEWNELDASERQLQEGIALAEASGHNNMMVYGLTVLAKVMQAKGEQDHALQLLQQASCYMPDHQHNAWIMAVASALQTRLALIQRNMAAVEEWKPTSSRNFIVHIFEELTLARIYIHTEESQKALTLLHKHICVVEMKGQTNFLIEIFLLQALVYQQQHNIPQAITTLLHALERAEPEDHMRLFIDEGLPMVELLTATLGYLYQKSDRAPACSLAKYIKKLLLSFGKSQQEIEKTLQIACPKNKMVTDNLNRREIEIVRLIATGKSSHEIAQHIHISNNTVKWYMKSIYSKLGVHNRVQAILQVNELQI